ncbi:hypothetical protein ACFP3I_24825 [Chryseobacterium arachidis]
MVSIFSDFTASGKQFLSSSLKKANICSTLSLFSFLVFSKTFL